MEIKQGYTREQFINLIKDRKYQKYVKYHIDFSDFSLTNLGLIYRYNNLLKRPLIKGLFFPCNENGNIMNEPEFEEMGGELGRICIYGHDYLEEYKDAEKKVIFDMPKDYFEFDYDGVWYGGNFMYWNCALGDLFQATNGELKTKNITI